MKLKIVLLILAILANFLMVSCKDSEAEYRENQKKYKENLKKYQKNSITPEQREKALKSMFPNYKGRK